VVLAAASHSASEGDLSEKPTLDDEIDPASAQVGAAMPVSPAPNQPGEARPDQAGTADDVVEKQKAIDRNGQAK